MRLTRADLCLKKMEPPFTFVGYETFIKLSNRLIYDIVEIIERELEERYHERL